MNSENELRELSPSPLEFSPTPPNTTDFPDVAPSSSLAKEPRIQKEVDEVQPTKASRFMELFSFQENVLHKEQGFRKHCLFQAETSLQIAHKILDPNDGIALGQVQPLAIEIYRHCIYWLLAAKYLDSQPLPSNLTELVAQLPSTWRKEVQVSESQWEQVQLVLLEENLMAHSFQSAHLLTEHLSNLQKFTSFLQNSVTFPERTTIRQRRIRHTKRTGIVLLIVMITAIVGAFGYWVIRPKDLAQLHPWKSSSGYPNFIADLHTVDGSKSEIFFHTNQDPTPWIEFDVGNQQSVSKVRVQNRKEGTFASRAVPLVIEVSTDHTSWTEVARKNEPFHVWQAKFSPTNTHYVRLRVLKKSFLHLENVNIYR
jgi:hypothetical protein